MKTILIADDELSIRILVQATLENPDARIVQATNGNEALQFAIAELPDAIVLDWMMPGLSGLDVLKALRLRTDTVNIPVIMLTARSQGKDQTNALKLGAQAYLMKPFSPLELLHVLQQVMQTALLGSGVEDGIGKAAKISAQSA
jgi:DNA-binding response OmpR family regulator